MYFGVDNRPKDEQSYLSAGRKLMASGPLEPLRLVRFWPHHLFVGVVHF